MDLEKKKKIALFRFGVIHPLISINRSEMMKKESLIRDIVSKEWEIPYSEKTSVSRATVLSWLKAYRDSDGNLESLFPKGRIDAGRPRKMDEEVELSLVNLKSSYPNASLPTLLRIAQSEGILPVDFKASNQTIYRVFRKHGVHIKSVKQDDSRKFRAELPNDLWQSDAMHGPYVTDGNKRRKTYLFAIIDDHSRLITHAEFYFNENLKCYINCLQSAFAKRGLPRKLYVDNGAAFRSHNLKYIAASLGVAIIHARPYRPQGKGKIERWFKTVQTQLLSEIPHNITLDDLNMRLQNWIENKYHRTTHSTIKQAPFESFSHKLHLIRKAPSNLNEYFRKYATRKVKSDRTISLYGEDYEAPLGLSICRDIIDYHKGEILVSSVVNKGSTFIIKLPKERTDA